MKIQSRQLQASAHNLVAASRADSGSHAAAPARSAAASGSIDSGWNRAVSPGIRSRSSRGSQSEGQLSHMAHSSDQYTSLNSPEENDETSSQEFESDILLNHSTTVPQPTHNVHQRTNAIFSHQHPPPSLTHQTPFPSWVELRASPQSLPSALYHTLSDSGSFFPSRPHSLPGSCSPSLVSLEHPRSLHSFLHSGDFYHHQPPLPSYPDTYMRPPCCTQCRPAPQQQIYRPSGLTQYRQVDTHFSENAHAPLNSRPAANQSITHLPQEQRKVFVTYEADSEEHLKEIIKFVSLLRNNGFDTHKDYLIIIIISLRYYETICSGNISVESDERTSNTVYIHKQLQSEFIQNGCRNYRFIPILFPGAKKCYVPAWLQNTHVYSWPADRDDILRRLMRVEKYRPPPVGSLPAIFSIPL
ncbi:uncharacterized protein traf3ip2b isoform X2 [Danio rerio]|uniref:Uncharacterized protein traf3ip2b isoform X2 n=2 Tax=Danio rerio TaxID=7955 RepID=A0AC58GU81_DANRE